MKKATSLIFSVLALAALPRLSLAALGARNSSVPATRPASYNGWTRTSDYVTVRDGTRIAVDVLRPAYNGAAEQKPLPVILEQRRYHRASLQAGRIYCQLDRGDHPMRNVGRSGYAYVVADVRGGGASFGTRTDPNPPMEVLDIYDLTEWIAKQDWCDGKIGMYGISYGGTAQFTAAAGKPTHLKAAFPEMAMFDLYAFCYPGGIFRRQTIQTWSQLTTGLDRNLNGQAAPVDRDNQGQWLKAAVAEHSGNQDVFKDSLSQPFRDAYMQSSKGPHYVTHSASSHLEQINQSGVAIYLRAGWWDAYPKDMLLWYVNLKTPKKIVIGPWNHYSSEGFSRSEQMQRWYDYWLKRIDNGITDEPPIRYYTLGAPRGSEWRTSHTWPPESSRLWKYYFHAGPSGSVRSVNDGLMSPAEPTVTTGEDRYVVDYTTTSGTLTRWTLSGAPPNYPDMQTNDRKGLTYTTEPLKEPVEVTGHPVIHLWVSSSADDGDFFAYLEDVDENGGSHYISEGMLRASHRKVSAAPFDNLGLPYHRSFEQDIEKLPSEPVELVFDLLPISKVFAANHRIRVVITCADKDNADTPVLSSAPQVRLYRNATLASYAELPIVETESKEASDGVSADGPFADLVITNGKVLTIDKNNPLAEAIAIKGETIVAVTSNARIERYIKEGLTEIIDARGRLVTPGFNDAHIHFSYVDPDYIDLRYMTDPGAITERVKEAVARARPGELIRGGRWEHEMFTNRQWPTKELIDPVSPDNPVVLSRADGHSVLVNTYVIRHSGITRQTPDPFGGEIQRHPATGEPTGIFKETAKALLKYGDKPVSRSSEEQQERRMRGWQVAFDMAAKNGVTSIQLPPGGDFEIYEKFRGVGKLTVRVYIGGSLTADEQKLRRCAELQKKYPREGNWIRFGYLKGFIDGTLGSGTALFFEPYVDAPDKTGLPQMPYEELEKLVVTADKAGFQIGIHAIGDKANHWVLNAYGKARQLNGRRDSRHRIEHAQVLAGADIPRFASLGVIASMQPTHCITDKRFAEKRIGAERCEGAYAWRRLLDAKAAIAFGTDYPVEPISPLEGLYAAVTRKDRAGEPGDGWFADQKLSMEKAIELYTLGSAYAEFAEDRKGMIKEGYLADIVIFDSDLTTIPHDLIMSAKVDYTVVGGKVVYRRQ